MEYDTVIAHGIDVGGSSTPDAIERVGAGIGVYHVAPGAINIAVVLEDDAALTHGVDIAAGDAPDAIEFTCPFRDCHRAPACAVIVVDVAVGGTTYDEDIVPVAAPDTVERAAGKGGEGAPTEAVIMQDDTIAPGVRDSHSPDICRRAPPDIEKVEVRVIRRQAPNAAVVVEHSAIKSHCPDISGGASPDGL